ncbi:MAG: RNase adapter RapZ [Trueperaceae bacterium]|nr:RNase adapter RapZ [Trueperaceae bacterium]
MRVVILTGMSGAGKTTALHALEDAGFLAVDNLPPRLWPTLATTVHEAGHEALAIGIDVRGAAFLGAAPAALEDLHRAGFTPQVVFLDARDETLVRRFSFTRRTHPLQRGALGEDLAAERDSLELLRSHADVVVDTTTLTERDLRTRMQRLSGDDRFQLRLVSFGYKRGVPTDVDAVLDVRGMRNPFYDDVLRPLPGTDPRVQSHVFAHGGHEAYAPLRAMTRDLAEAGRRSGRGGYAVAIGCTGGQHRSVAVVERLAHDLADAFAVEASHRDLADALAEHRKDAEADADGPSERP